MDKNMIHIDDLVRQRLIGEEEERAGAWLRMKDLLDKDMPNKAAGFAWRKTLVSAAVVVALATAGLTAYEMSSSFRGNGIDSNVEKAANPSFATNKATENTNTPNTSLQTPVVENQSNTSNNSSAPVVAGATNGHKATNTNTTNNNVRSTGNNNSANKTNNANTSNQPVTASSADAVTNTTAKNNTVNNQPQQTTSPTTTTPATSPNGNNRDNSSSSSATATPPVSGNERSTPATAGTTKDVPYEEFTSRTKVNNFTGEVTDTREQTGQGTTQVPVPAAPAPEVAAAPEPKIASAPPREFIPYGPPPDEFPSMMANSASGKNDGKAAGKATQGKKGWNFHAFADFMDRATYQMGQTKVQTGIIGGFNTTFGNYGMRGFNVGLYTNFVFNPNWSVKMEGKYVQRFNNNTNTYDNDYTKYVPGTNGMYTQEERRHFFKYSSVSSLEMPIMLTYTANNKITAFVGGNLAYNFNIKAEETERTTVIGNVANAGTSKTPMTLSDFNSRFGMGYIVGAGYQFSKQVGLDVRMVQTVWDNAKGTGAQQISKDIYKTPSGQITLTYRFGANQKEN